MVNRIMDFEAGLLSEEEVIELFRDLIDSGMINHLQGSYGRIAQALINDGLL